MSFHELRHWLVYGLLYTDYCLEWTLIYGLLQFDWILLSQTPSQHSTNCLYYISWLSFCGWNSIQIFLLQRKASKFCPILNHNLQHGTVNFFSETFYSNTWNKRYLPPMSWHIRLNIIFFYLFLTYFDYILRSNLDFELFYFKAKLLIPSNTGYCD